MAQLRRGYAGREVSQAIDGVQAWLPRITYVHCPGWSAERVAADMQRLYAQGACDVAIVTTSRSSRYPRARVSTAP